MCLQHTTDDFKFMTDMFMNFNKVMKSLLCSHRQGHRGQYSCIVAKYEETDQNYFVEGGGALIPIPTPLQSWGVRSPINGGEYKINVDQRF